MRITLGSPWVDAEGVTHVGDETIDVDAPTARRLLGDGTARPADPVDVTESGFSGESTSGETDG